MRTSIRNATRSAFTLVELLVVIAIIGILVSLLGAGIFAIVNRGRDAQCATEIGQLVTAMGTFKSKFGMYPPSKIRLVECMIIYNGTGAVPTVPHYYNLTMNGQTPAHPLDYNSVAYLKQMWPRIYFQTWPNVVANTGVNWSGSATPTYSGSYILEGDQCLVFFLGGIPTNSPTPVGTLGFSNSPTDPSQAPSGANQQRLGPYFNFNSNRLVLLHGNPFYSYFDTYGVAGQPASKPYAYFSSLRGLKNQYNPYFGHTSGGGTTYYSDCTLIGALPYMSGTINAYPPPANSAPSYQNPDTFQIISAGADQLFGSVPNSTNSLLGVIWDPSHTPASFSPVMPQQLHNGKTEANPGADDRANFCPNILAAGNAQN